MRVDNLEHELDQKYDRYSNTERSLSDSERTASDPQQDFYNREFNGMVNDNLKDSEERGNNVIKDHTPVMHKGKPAKKWQLLTSAKLRGKSSLIAVALVLFGGGGFMSILLPPGIAITHFKEILTDD